MAIRAFGPPTAEEIIRGARAQAQALQAILFQNQKPPGFQMLWERAQNALLGQTLHEGHAYPISEDEVGGLAKQLREKKFIAHENVQLAPFAHPLWQPTIEPLYQSASLLMALELVELRHQYESVKNGPPRTVDALNRIGHLRDLVCGAVDRELQDLQQSFDQNLSRVRYYDMSKVNFEALARSEGALRFENALVDAGAGETVVRGLSNALNQVRTAPALYLNPADLQADKELGNQPIVWKRQPIWDPNLPAIPARDAAVQTALAIDFEHAKSGGASAEENGVTTRLLNHLTLQVVLLEGSPKLPPELIATPRMREATAVAIKHLFHIAGGPPEFNGAPRLAGAPAVILKQHLGPVDPTQDAALSLGYSLIAAHDKNFAGQRPKKADITGAEDWALNALMQESPSAAVWLGSHDRRNPLAVVAQVRLSSDAAEAAELRSRARLLASIAYYVAATNPGVFEMTTALPLPAEPLTVVKRQARSSGVAPIVPPGSITP